MDRQRKTPSLAESLAAETSEGAGIRGLLPDRLKRYGTAKGRSLAVSDYINCQHPDHSKLAQLIRGCGDWLRFRDYYLRGEVRLAGACFCKKHLLCPLCAIRRGAKHLSRYLDRFESIRASRPSLVPYMVTLTIKDGPDLAERFAHIQKSMKLLRKRRAIARTRSEAKKAAGAVWSFEVKRGKGSGLWHPHLHAVWLCEVPPDPAALSAEWHQITGDSYIVDVRPIDTSDPLNGFLEVFKYAVKFSDQPEADTWHCFETLKGKRLVASFGEFYGIPEPDDLIDDPLEGEPYVDYFYRYLPGFGYQLSGHPLGDNVAGERSNASAPGRVEPVHL